MQIVMSAFRPVTQLTPRPDLTCNMSLEYNMENKVDKRKSMPQSERQIYFTPIPENCLDEEDTLEDCDESSLSSNRDMTPVAVFGLAFTDDAMDFHRVDFKDCWNMCQVLHQEESDPDYIDDVSLTDCEDFSITSSSRDNEEEGWESLLDDPDTFWKIES